MRREVGMLRGEEGVGVWGELMVRQVRGERLGAGEGSVWLVRGGDQRRLVVRLRLRGDVWLVVQVHVD